MTADTVNLVVTVPESLRRRVRVTANARGETISAVVRRALAEYVERSESEADDVRFATAVLTRIAEGTPTYTHEEVWAAIAQREAAGELSD